jgi:hypothetical protein
VALIRLMRESADGLLIEEKLTHRGGARHSRC